MADIVRIPVRLDKDMEELVPGFIAGRHEDIVSIRAALAKGDMGTVRILGHSMKGAGGSYGFGRITVIGAAMEQAAMAGNKAGVEQLAAELADYLTRVEITYV
jgi:HPt (histidine-containing phosphotransfer) domain-containing protein